MLPAPDLQWSSFSLPVFRSLSVNATQGANEGDSFGRASDLVLDDVYRLANDAYAHRLVIETTHCGVHLTAGSSELGHPGCRIQMDCTATLMCENGSVTDVIVLVEADREGRARDVFVMPLAPLKLKTDYRLIDVKVEAAEQSLAQTSAVSFTGNTRITLATGDQKRVEDLRPGDVVSTRDCGDQPIRKIIRTTHRASATSALIRISADALGNCHDLLVGPDHQLLVCEQDTANGRGRQGKLVKASDLVNGTSVTEQDTGTIDGFQILFGSHQTIYAEGIAVMTNRADDQSTILATLPHRQSVHGFGSALGGDVVDLQVANLDQPHEINSLHHLSL